jgi:hypothetical protein
MGIISINTDTPGLVGVNPRNVKIISSDNLATVLEEGYLNPITLEGYTILTTDVIQMWYDYVNDANPGTYDEFTVSITDGVITLVMETQTGNVTTNLPTVARNVPVWSDTAGELDKTGYVISNQAFPNVVTVESGNGVHNIAVFYDESGSIEDLGIAFSNPNLPVVVSVNGATVVNNLPEFADTAGTIRDSGISPTNGALAKVSSFSGTSVAANIPVFSDTAGSIQPSTVSFSNASNPKASTVSGAITVGHVPSFTDTSGSIIDSGQRMPFATSVSGAAGSATVVFTVPGVALADACWFAPNTIINSVAQVSCAATGTNQVTVVFTGDTGGVAGYVWVQKAP